MVHSSPFYVIDISMIRLHHICIYKSRILRIILIASYGITFLNTNRVKYSLFHAQFIQLFV